MFQQGTQPIGSGITTVDVEFPLTFPGAPDIILAVVSNTSGDSPKFLIEADVVYKDAYGFTVQLTGVPDTNNYVLGWVAGSVEILYQALAKLGIKISALPMLLTEPGSDDYVPLVHTYPIPLTTRMTWGLIRSLFPGLIADPPASPAAAGVYGQMALDADGWLYVHNGILWGRTQLFQTSWDVTALGDDAQEGVVAMVQNQGYVDIVYPAAFSVAPKVWFSIRNLSADANKTMLVGVQISGNTVGARIQLNTAPETGHYELVWRAQS